MSSRTVIFIALGFIALFLLVAAALVWPQLQPRGLIVNDSARRERHDNHEDACAPDNREPRANKPAYKPGVVVSGGKPVERATPGIDVSKLAEDEVVVRAQVTLRGPHGLDVFRMAQREPWTLCIRFVESADYSADHYFEGDANGRVETPYSRDALPIENNALTAGTWQARICWNETEAFVPIATPLFQDRVLNFGTLELDLGAALDPTEWLICGRLLHTSGLPISNFEYLAMRFGGPDKDTNWIGVCEDGRFAFSAYDFEKEQPAWLIVGEDEDSAPKRLGAPKIEGRIVDFGDITLDCAAVEIRLAGWPDPALRRARRGIGADVELDPLSFWVSFSNYATNLEVSLEEPDTTCVRFLNPGPYRWEAGVGEDTLAFAEMQGELDLPAGKLTRLDISLTPVHCVLARFKAARPLEQVALEVSKARAEGADDVDDGSYTVGVGNPSIVYAIANAGHEGLHVVAKARGYEPVTLDLGPDTTECLIEFTQALPSQQGKLIVVLPKLPEALHDKQFTFAICVTYVVNGVENTRELAHIGRGDDAWGEEDVSRLSTYDVDMGIVQVTLREREPGMGYPRGIVCGPVECNIEPDKTTTVKMPALAAPPWGVFSQRTSVRLSCEKQPISYTGPVLRGERVQNMSLYHNQNTYMPYDDYAIPDGEARIPLEFQMPDAETGTAVYYHEFPARVEIRVKRGKELVPTQVMARISMDTGGADISGVSVNHGTLRLWAPAGKARLEVDVPGTDSLNREIEVKSELTVIEIELKGTFVRLQWDERYRDEGGAPWMLRDEQGKALTSIAALEPSIKLAPGNYSMAPQHMSKPEITFVLGAVEDAVVNVPYVAALDFSASMLLRFPKDLKPDPDGYSLEWRWYVPLSGDAAQDQRTRDYSGDSSWTRFTPEGCKFCGLPVDVEIVFVVALGALDDNDNLSSTAWTMTPTRVRLKGEGTETIAVEWKRGVVMDESWQEGYEIAWTGALTQGMTYDEYWRVLLPGTYTLNLVNETGKSFTLTLKLEEGKFFEMPEDIRKARFGEDEDPGGD